MIQYPYCLGKSFSYSNFSTYTATICAPTHATYLLSCSTERLVADDTTQGFLISMCWVKVCNLAVAKRARTAACIAICTASIGQPGKRDWGQCGPCTGKPGLSLQMAIGFPAVGAKNNLFSIPACDNMATNPVEISIKFESYVS